MIETLLTTAAPALMPAVADGVRGLFGMVTGGQGAKPQSVDEVIKLQRAGIDKMRALAELDKAENVHRWVSDIRALQRPVAVAGVLAGYAWALHKGAPAAVDQWGELARMAIFYLFGDRTYAHLKRTGRNDG